MSREQSIKNIDLGFPESMDRYSLVACERDEQAAMLARRLEQAVDAKQFYHPPEWVKELFKNCVMQLYSEIPVKIEVFCCAGEPYVNSELMQQDVSERSRLIVRRRQVGPFAGALTQQWRTVHDYYGHVLMKAPFTLRGEFAAYAMHTQQFPRPCWPFIWNNVVLENAYRLNRGHFLCINQQCSSPIIYDAEQFGPQAQWHSPRF